MDVGDHLHRSAKSTSAEVQENHCHLPLFDLVADGVFLRSAHAKSSGQLKPSLRPIFMIGYSLFSLSEWALVLLEAGFDAVSILDFRRLDIQIVERIEVEAEDETGNIFPENGLTSQAH